MKKIKLMKKLYWFDEVLLTFKRHTKAEIIRILLFVSFLFFLIYFVNDQFRPDIVKISEKQQLIVIDEFTKFSPEKLVKLIKELNILHPHIVYAQTYQECTYNGKRFNSLKFWDNHNLFGMKEAQMRPTTATGTNNDAAVYTTWQNSVIDYALWQARFSERAKDEDVYLSILQQVYAEDTAYVKKLKILIKTENLKELFK